MSTPTRDRVADPERILVIRLSAVGDNVLATPLVGCLRARYPGARISWLAEPLAAPLLEAHPDVDEVLVWPRGELRRDWRAGRWSKALGTIRRFRRTLLDRRFDWAIDAQGLLKSGWLARASGARRRVGLGSREGSGLLMTEVVARRHDHPLIGGEYHDLARALDLPVDGFRTELPLSAERRAGADDLVGRLGIGEGFVALVPFTTRPQKHWIEDRWGPLGEALRERHGLRPVLLGGPGDAEAAARIRGDRQGWVDLTGDACLPVADAAALIERAALLIGVDTGMTHMGTALRRPTVALFGSTIPYRDPLSPRTAILFEPQDCQPCRKHPTCDGAYTCMYDLALERVLQTAGAVLGRTESTM